MKKIDIENLDPNIEPDEEKLHRGARIALAAVPLAGGVLTEVFNSVMESPLSKRRSETVLQIAHIINELIDKGVVTEEGLRENEAFISTVAEVCSIALRNHQAEKLEALRNAVKNTARGKAPEDDLRQMFLSFVDVFTVTHLRLLKLMRNPMAWIKEQGREFPQSWYMGGQNQVVEFAYPDLKGKETFYQIIWTDLYQRGLFSSDRFGTTMTVQGMTSPCTTGLGNSFIDFIED